MSVNAAEADSRAEKLQGKHSLPDLAVRELLLDLQGTHIAEEVGDALAALSLQEMGDMQPTEEVAPAPWLLSLYNVTAAASSPSHPPQFSEFGCTAPGASQACTAVVPVDDLSQEFASTVQEIAPATCPLPDVSQPGSSPAESSSFSLSVDSQAHTFNAARMPCAPCPRSPCSPKRPLTLGLTPRALKTPPTRTPPQSPMLTPVSESCCHTFSFQLLRAEGVALGLDVKADYIGNYLYVERVFSGGAIHAWNRLCDRDPTISRAVLPGDCIVAINAASDPDAMLEEVKDVRLLKIVVTRADSDP